MSGYNLVFTLGVGSLIAFALFFIYFKILRWGGKVSALATAASMLLIYVPLSITHWIGLDVFAIHFAIFMMIPYGLGIITGVQEERRKREGLSGQEPSKGGMHWIPALIIVFFIMLAVVDSVIISFATGGMDKDIAKILLPESKSEDVGAGISSQFTGAVSNDLQNKEQQFDVYVAKLQKQRERGWRISGGWQGIPEINKPAVFELMAKDRSGNPVDKAKVTVEFRRPSDMSHDKLFTLTESTPGEYSAEVELALAGCWDMKILLMRDQDEHELQGQTSIAGRNENGELYRRECIDGEPDVELKRQR